MGLPTEMTALVADATGTSAADAVARLRLTRVPVPHPRRGQVLVRMRAAPCNPADLLYLEGRYGIDRPLPAVPGFEGAGEVVASGGGLLGRWLVGKRVACGGHDCSGTWAEYCLAAADQCLPLRRGLDFDTGATSVANPITALALVGLVTRGRHRAYVQTAAASQLGRMVVTIANARRLPGIHVVRRAEQGEVLRHLGATHVLVSTAPDFDATLAARCRELGATIALDAVAGRMTGQLLNALPPGGEVVVYGALSDEPSGGVDPMGLAFGHKRIRGFEIAGHLREIGLFGAIRLARTAQKLVASGKTPTTVRDRIPLAEAPAKLPAYTQAMSDGKMLLLP